MATIRAEGDSTYNVDLQYFEDFLRNPSSVPGNKIDDPDEVVLAVGQAYNRALTINNIDYDYNPAGGRNGCNSNCAAGIIADEAREVSGRQGGHPAPQGAQQAPGRGQRSRLDDLVRTPIELNRARHAAKGLGTRIKKEADND